MLVKKQIEIEVLYDTEKKRVIGNQVVLENSMVSWTQWLSVNNELVEIKPELPDSLTVCLTDSDIVFDEGESVKRLFEQHVVTENFANACLLYCPETNHIYRHLIRDKNKAELICRGCGRAI